MKRSKCSLRAALGKDGRTLIMGKDMIRTLFGKATPAALWTANGRGHGINQAGARKGVREKT